MFSQSPNSISVNIYISLSIHRIVMNAYLSRNNSNYRKYYFRHFSLFCRSSRIREILSWRKFTNLVFVLDMCGITELAALWGEIIECGCVVVGRGDDNVDWDITQSWQNFDDVVEFMRCGWFHLKERVFYWRVSDGNVLYLQPWNSSAMISTELQHRYFYLTVPKMLEFSCSNSKTVGNAAR